MALASAVNQTKPLLQQWSIPPYDAASTANITGPVSGSGDQSIVMTQAIVYEVNIAGDTLLQNVSENEDDYIEWSQHGDPDGNWMRIDVGNLLEVGAGTKLFLYNRTHKQNSIMSVYVK